MSTSIFTSPLFILHTFSICNVVFHRNYTTRYWKGNSEVTENSSWLPLCVSSCHFLSAFRSVLTNIDTHLRHRRLTHTSFPRSENVELQVHLQYFRQAVSLSQLCHDRLYFGQHSLTARIMFLSAGYWPALTGPRSSP